ncbi:MAG: GNAT family N-acetyltransferase, partial [Acidimicrobiia bacterium]
GRGRASLDRSDADREPGPDSGGAVMPSTPPPRPLAPTIRTASTVDATAIAGIHVRSWIATYGKPPSKIENDIDRRTKVWRQRLGRLGPWPRTMVAVADGAITGFIYFGPSPDPDHDPARTAQVFSLHVDPEMTGRGVGRMLLEHATATMEAEGFSEATLWAVAANPNSRGFYERLGWQADGGRRREPLAVEGESGAAVEVVRYHLPLTPDQASAP